MYPPSLPFSYPPFTPLSYPPLTSSPDVWRTKSTEENSKHGSTSKSHFTDSDPDTVSMLIERMGNLVLPVQSLFQQLCSSNGMISSQNATGNNLRREVITHHV